MIIAEMSAKSKNNFSCYRMALLNRELGHSSKWAPPEIHWIQNILNESLRWARKIVLIKRRDNLKTFSKLPDIKGWRWGRGGGDLYGMRRTEGKIWWDRPLGCRKKNYFDCIAWKNEKLFAPLNIHSTLGLRCSKGG